jgi:hypothetical protein
LIAGECNQQLKGLSFHDEVWFQAIRGYREVKSRTRDSMKDKVLDFMIVQGLIDHKDEEITPAMNQFARYSAVLAQRLHYNHLELQEQVSFHGCGWLR